MSAPDTRDETLEGLLHQVRTLATSLGGWFLEETARDLDDSQAAIRAYVAAIAAERDALHEAMERVNELAEEHDRSEGERLYLVKMAARGVLLDIHRAALAKEEG